VPRMSRLTQSLKARSDLQDAGHAQGAVGSGVERRNSVARTPAAMTPGRMTRLSTRSAIAPVSRSDLRPRFGSLPRCRSTATIERLVGPFDLRRVAAGVEQTGQDVPSAPMSRGPRSRLSGWPSSPRLS
jgi:hypothetical protein